MKLEENDKNIYLKKEDWIYQLKTVLKDPLELYNHLKLSNSSNFYKKLKKKIISF